METRLTNFSMEKYSLLVNSYLDLKEMEDLYFFTLLNKIDEDGRTNREWIVERLLYFYKNGNINFIEQVDQILDATMGTSEL